MRRVLLGALAAAVVVGGCGSSSTGSPTSPLATVVSYFPATSPFVLTVNTNAQSRSVNALKTAESRIPFFAAVKAAELLQLPAGIEKTSSRSQAIRRRWAKRVGGTPDLPPGSWSSG